MPKNEVFGPFCKANYNSFIATFCSRILIDQNPEIIHDSKVPLIYIENLVKQIMKKLVRGSFVGPPRGPLLEPKSINKSQKKGCENHIEKHWAQSAAKEDPREPLKS